MRDYDKIDNIEKVRDAIANMLYVYIERYGEYIKEELKNRCEEEAKEDAEHILAYYDFFKDTLKTGTLEELEAYYIPYFRMISSGVTLHEVI